VSRRPLLAIAAVAWVIGCIDSPTAPGRCPDFCPPGRITILDTLLTTVIERDTAFGPYVEPPGSITLIASEVPAVIASRPVLRFQPIGGGVRYGADTMLRPITATDSAKFAVTILRHDTSVRNLRLHLYRLPVSIDTNTTFADLAGSFGAAPVRVVNVDSLVRAANHKDTVTKDSVFVSNSGSVRVMITLDSAQARYVAADSGVLGYGVRVTGDAATSIALGSNDSPDPPLVHWHLSVDSAGTTAHIARTVAPQFDSYVFDPPFAPLDGTLAVGGIPTARSLLRLTLPPRLRDSTQILRATLQLVPSTPARGSAIDTFTIVANAVAADLGGKSPLVRGVGSDSSYFGTGSIILNSTDTVRVEITRLLRRWSADTTQPMAFYLLSASEGITLTQIRFHSSRNAAFKPSILITYAGHFPFGIP
jgi:hypothetical protein